MAHRIVFCVVDRHQKAAIEDSLIHCGYHKVLFNKRYVYERWFELIKIERFGTRWKVLYDISDLEDTMLIELVLRFGI